MREDDNQLLNYTRQSLRKATKFTEGDYRGINPREFFRSLNRALGEIKEDNDFKYTTIGGPTESLTINSEDVGSKTGTVEGRLVATSDYKDIGAGSVKYKRYGPHGAWLIVIGILTSFLILPLLLIPVGIYLYLKEERGEFPLLRRDEIRVLVTGEVSERTIDEAGEERTDIFANISTIYAGDTFIKINTDELEDYDLAHRKEIVSETKQIFNRIIEEEEQKRDVQDGTIAEFIGHLKAVSNMDVEQDNQEIGDMQQILNSKFEYRLQYADKLLQFLPSQHEDELESHHKALMDELEELSQDMDIYVEREGLEPA